MPLKPAAVGIAPWSDARRALRTVRGGRTVWPDCKALARPASEAACLLSSTIALLHEAESGSRFLRVSTSAVGPATSADGLSATWEATGAISGYQCEVASI
jgi:hypothetical protein